MAVPSPTAILQEMIGRRLWGLLSLIALMACGGRTDLPHPPIPDAEIIDEPEPAREIPCIDVPLDGSPVRASLELEARIGAADVIFLIDVTLSMGEEIDRIRERLRDRIAPGIHDAIPDARLGVASFADFPITPYGEPGLDYPFKLHVRATDDLIQVQSAMDALRLGNGFDEPESQVEALYQLVTGDGLFPHIPPSLGCPSGGWGYACIRDDSLPVILLFTDAPFHQGPRDFSKYSPSVLGTTPHSYADAIVALNGVGAKVIGFDSGVRNLSGDHLRQLARDTGTLDEHGRPLVFNIGPTGLNLDNDVVDAVRTFASSFIQDIDALARDPNPYDEVDMEALIPAIRPVEAIPADGIDRIDEEANRFVGVRAGTIVTFELVIDSSLVEQREEAQRIPADVLFRGDGRIALDVQRVELLIPGFDGLGCEELADNDRSVGGHRVAEEARSL